MQPKKITKEKAQIHQQKLTNDNLYNNNYKYNFTKTLFLNNQEGRNQDEMNIESKNPANEIINTELKPNIEIDESNNSNNNENTSSNKDEKKFNSSLESQGNTNNSSNKMKKGEKKSNKFNIEKNYILNKKKESNHKKDRRRRKEQQEIERITTNDIFRSIEEEGKSSENNKMIISENKLAIQNSNNDKNIQINSINITKNINNYSYNINNTNDRTKINTKSVNILDSRYNTQKNEYNSTINVSNTNNTFVNKKYTSNVEENTLNYMKSKSCRKTNMPYKGLFKTEILYTKTNEKNYSTFAIRTNINNLKIQNNEGVFLTSKIKKFDNIEIDNSINDFSVIDKPLNSKPNKINIIKKSETRKNSNTKEQENEPKEKTKKNHMIDLNGNKIRKKDTTKNEPKTKKRERKNKKENKDTEMKVEHGKKPRRQKRDKSNTISNAYEIKIVSDVINSNETLIEKESNKISSSFNINEKDKKLEINNSILNKVIDLAENNNNNFSNELENIIPKKENLFSNFSDKMNNINNNSECDINMENLMEKENNKNEQKESSNMNNNSEINLNNTNNNINNESNSFNAMKVHNINNESLNSLNNIKNLINNENNNSYNIGNNNISNINSEDLLLFKHNVFISNENNNNTYNFNSQENVIPENNNYNYYPSIFKNSLNSPSNENNIKENNNSNQTENNNNNQEINDNIEMNNNSPELSPNKNNNENSQELNEINDINNDIREEVHMYINNASGNIEKEIPEQKEEKDEDIEMKEEIEDIKEIQEDKNLEENEEIKINDDDIEMLDSKEDSNNNISINDKTITEHRISLGNPSKSKSKSELTIQSENTSNEKDDDGIPFPNLSEFLPCREKEQEAIYKYIKTGLSTKGNYSSLYISGMPGTGKTECVKRVIHVLENQYAKKGISKFQYIYINGIEYEPPERAFKAIHDSIFVKKKKLFSFLKSLDDYFKNRNNYDSSVYLKNPNNCHIILILDEVDQLILNTDKSQNLLYNIFNWTTYPQSKLIVLSISNTLDLPNRLLSKVQSRMGNNKIMFKPYTKDDLYKIIISLGINMKLYSEDALKLSTMKVAAFNGDLRRAILILKRSKEIFEDDKKNIPQISDKDLISKYYILQACEQLFDSKITKVLRMLQISEKIILAALLTRLKDSNENRISVGELYENIDKFLDKYNESTNIYLEINWYEYEKIIYNLLRLKIVSFVDGQKDNFIDNYIVTKFYTDEFMAACDGIDSMKPIIDLINNLLGNNYGE